MSWIVTLLIGGAVGWLASILLGTDAQMGVIANVLVGLVGSALGFWIAGAAGLVPAGGVMSFVVAMSGALLLVIALRASGMFRGK